MAANAASSNFLQHQALARCVTLVVVHRWHRLDRIGYEVGTRYLELSSYREKVLRRKPEILEILRFIHNTAWPYMFGKSADDLQQAAAVRWAGGRITVEVAWDVERTQGHVVDASGWPASAWMTLSTTGWSRTETTGDDNSRTVWGRQGLL